MATIYKIHPTIGIARLGNSDPESHFIGPEVPGLPSELYAAPFRDQTGAIRRQGARFRVYACHDDGTIQEVRVGRDVAAIKWTVHLANKKAFWYEFHGRTGESSPDISSGQAVPYPADSLRNFEEGESEAARRKRWIIDPLPRSLRADGKAAVVSIAKGRKARETWPRAFTGEHQGRKIDTLGYLAVDREGRLTVVGGAGVSGSVTSSKLDDYANNDGWFDDTSDGPVQAVIHGTDGSVQAAAAAWVIVGPPRFAPAIPPVVSLYDAIYDVAVRHHGHQPGLYDPVRHAFRVDYRPAFTAEIYPILRAAELVHWALGEVRFISIDNHHAWDYEALARGTGVGRISPAAIFGWLRRIEDWHNPATRRQMPRLHGDEGAVGDEKGPSFLTLTRTQMHLMRQWSRGQFVNDWAGVPIPPPAHQPPTPEGLDRAALENCIGGAFYPGIEAGWIMRDPRIFLPDDPFRINVLPPGADEHDVRGLTPGSATMRSALPWQADFNDCVDEWWPSHRPSDVIVDDRVTPPRVGRWARDIEDAEPRDTKPYSLMAKNWHKLGFLLSQNQDGQPPFVERER